MPGQGCLTGTRFGIVSMEGAQRWLRSRKKQRRVLEKGTPARSQDRHRPCLDQQSAGDSCIERKHSMSTITTTPQPAMSSPLKRLITRYPLLAFFVIAFAGTWIVTLSLVLAQNGLGLLPYTVPALGPISPAYWFSVL